MIRCIQGLLASLLIWPGASVLAAPVDTPAVTPPSQVVAVRSDAALQGWVSRFRPTALARGIAPSVYDRAMADVRYLPDVVRRDRSQFEFTKTIWDYLSTAVSDTRVSNGRRALRRHQGLLRQIESRYGVEAEVLVAIWGLESAYGEVRGSTPILSAMATLAHDGRRGRFFEGQLIAALRILQSGDTTLRQLKGSWAGAMGHTQFMPTSYQAYAVDWDGDGRRDIWGNDPADALASAAAYLARHGWNRGQPWGVEVQLPDGFDYAQASRSITRSPAAWARMGVVGLDGRAVPNHGAASLLVPAGHQGAAFMIFENFAVLERYNTADAYVVAVGHLSDRITGGGPIRAGWPLGDRALTFDERVALQRLLTRQGYDTRGIDGRIGPLTIDAVRRYQRDNGMVPDGYASLRLLERLR